MVSPTAFEPLELSLPVGTVSCPSCSIAVRLFAIMESIFLPFVLFCMTLMILLHHSSFCCSSLSFSFDQGSAQCLLQLFLFFCFVFARAPTFSSNSLIKLGPVLFQVSSWLPCCISHHRVALPFHTVFGASVPHSLSHDLLNLVHLTRLLCTDSEVNHVHMACFCRLEFLSRDTKPAERVRDVDFIHPFAVHDVKVVLALTFSPPALHLRGW